MGRYIVRLYHEGFPYYLEWSTVVDAPVTCAMPWEEFQEHYQWIYGIDGMKDLPERMARVEEKGVSSRIDDSVEDLISGNRAGEDETSLTLEQIIDYYLVRRREGDRPFGLTSSCEED